MSWELVRLIVGTVLLAMGLLTFALELFGVNRFEFVLNRMHAAAMGDTLGIGVSLMGLIILSGMNFTSLKMLLVIVFLWFASPVASHLIARLEAMTDEELPEFCQINGLEREEDQVEKRTDALF